VLGGRLSRSESSETEKLLSGTAIVSKSSIDRCKL
jgi:hypothetical protein